MSTSDLSWASYGYDVGDASSLELTDYASVVSGGSPEILPPTDSLNPGQD